MFSQYFHCMYGYSHSCTYEYRILSRWKFIWHQPQSRQSAKLFLQSSELGLPQPLTRWRERGRESPNSDEGTYTVVLFIHKVRLYTCVLCDTNYCPTWKRLKNARIESGSDDKEWPISWIACRQELMYFVFLSSELEFLKSQWGLGTEEE